MNKDILSLAEIAQTYEAMRANFNGRTAQSNGFKFEQLISSLLHHEGLEPKTGYRPTGEQIDGSFFWNNTTFLVEAKWTKEKIPVSEIYTFKGKLDGKFHSTSGVFFSASGYSPDVEDALRFGKTINIILFNGNDIDLLFTNKVRFTVMMKYKLRQAGDTGNVLVPYELVDRSAKVDEVFETEPLETLEPEDNMDFHDWPEQAGRLDQLLVFVEGRKDIAIIQSLFASLKDELTVTYTVIPLTGAENIRLLPSLVSDFAKTRKVKGVLVFLDEDMRTPSITSRIRTITENFEKSSIPVRSEFVFLSETLKELLLSKVVTADQLKLFPAFRQTLDFLLQRAQENYNKEEEIILFSLEGALEDITFDIENESVTVWDSEWQHVSRIESLEELIDYLDTEVTDAVESGMPEWWVQSNSPIGYAYEVREYLSEHYKGKIQDIGWDPSEL